VALVDGDPIRSEHGGHLAQNGGTGRLHSVSARFSGRGSNVAQRSTCVGQTTMLFLLPKSLNYRKTLDFMGETM
jgi:hypothetical protein